jgi:hypothetical protein
MMATQVAQPETLPGIPQTGESVERRLVAQGNAEPVSTRCINPKLAQLLTA